MHHKAVCPIPCPVLAGEERPDLLASAALLARSGGFHELLMTVMRLRTETTPSTFSARYPARSRLV